MKSTRIILPLAGLLLAGMTMLAARGASRPAQTVAVTSQASLVQERITAEGRVVAYPGAEVTVGSDARGIVERLLVQEKDVVRKGDLLVVLQADELRAELEEARARVAEAEADIRLYEWEVERAEILWEKEVGPRVAVEKALRDRDAARARKETSRAAVRRVEAMLAKRRIVAPIGGVVTARLVEVGETVDLGAVVMQVSDLSRVRIEAEVDEFDAGLLADGAPVEIRADGFAGARWMGRVEEIPDSIVGRKMKPEDPGRLTDTRVLLTKIAFEEPTPLKLGQRVEVRIAAK